MFGRVDKRMELNKSVKESITNALFSLMEKKNFSDISVTDIIRHAKVARASYYRNFTSKESIVEKFIYGIIEAFRASNTLNNENKLSRENLKVIFDTVLIYKQELKAIFHAGLSGLFLNCMNAYCEESFQSGEIAENEIIIIYAFCGGLFNIIYKWITDGAKEFDQQSIFDSITQWFNF